MEITDKIKKKLAKKIPLALATALAFYGFAGMYKARTNVKKSQKTKVQKAEVHNNIHKVLQYSITNSGRNYKYIDSTTNRDTLIYDKIVGLPYKSLYHFDYDNEVYNNILTYILTNQNIAINYAKKIEKTEKYYSIFKKYGKDLWKSNLLESIVIAELKPRQFSKINKKTIEKKARYLSKNIDRLANKYKSVGLALIAYYWNEKSLDKAIDMYGRNWNEITKHIPNKVYESVKKVLGTNLILNFPFLVFDEDVNGSDILR